MTLFTILDDVLGKSIKGSRKLSASQIIGVKQLQKVGHKRFQSKQFLPFASQRNIKGQIIKNQQYNYQRQQNMTLNTENRKKFKHSHSSLSKKSIIDDRFKLNQLDHFRNINTKSHLEGISKFKEGLQALDNKQYQRNLNSVRKDEQNLIKFFRKSVQLNRYNNFNQEQNLNEYPSNNLLIAKSNRKQSLQLVHKKVNDIQRNTNNNKHKSSKSHHKLMLAVRKQNKNPELNSIEKNVKVHFNHPQLDKIRQSKRLTLKYLQIDQYTNGDKKFKQKVAQYKKIKQSMKNQMGSMI